MQQIFGFRLWTWLQWKDDTCTRNYVCSWHWSNTFCLLWLATGKTARGIYYYIQLCFYVNKIIYRLYFNPAITPFHDPNDNDYKAQEGRELNLSNIHLHGDHIAADSEYLIKKGPALCSLTWCDAAWLKLTWLIVRERFSRRYIGVIEL